MGTMCAVEFEGGNYYRQEPIKNSLTNDNDERTETPSNLKVSDIFLGQAVISIVLGNNFLIQGTFREIKAPLFFVYPQTKAQDTVHSLSNMAKTTTKQFPIKNPKQVLQNSYIVKIHQIKTKKYSPYKKLFIALLPEYKRQDNQEDNLHQYEKIIRTQVRKVFQQQRDITMYFTQCSGDGIIFPNQTVIALMLKQICTCVVQPTKITMISNEKKMLQMIRYEILKTQAYSPKNYQWNLQ